MARGLTIRFQGGEQLREKFLAMADEARTRTLEQAVPPAAEIVIDRMKQLVAVDTGGLRKSLAMKVVERTPTRLVMGMKTPAPHWHLIEFGHRLVSHAGKLIGQVTGRPFIRPAFDGTRTAMKNEIRDGIRDSIEGFTE